NALSTAQRWHESGAPGRQATVPLPGVSPSTLCNESVNSRAAAYRRPLLPCNPPRCSLAPMSAQSSSRRAAREPRHSLLIITVFMFSLPGMAALAIDAGSWYRTKRSLQADADAAALAGASQLPIGWTAAQTAAQAEYAKNGDNTDTVQYQNTNDLTTNDTVTVTASRSNPSFFAKLFGINNATITATSKATVESYTKVVSTGQIMPWGVMQSSWTLGQQYNLYVDNSTPNNGAISLKGKDSNGNCQGTSAAHDYRNEITHPLP